MPQIIKSPKKGSGFLGRLMLDESVPEEGYPDLNITPIEFNPGITADIELEDGKIETVNIYDRIFAPFEVEYENITGLKIDLSEGDVYGKSINRDTDQVSNHDLEMYKKEAMMIANEDIAFRNLPEAIKDRFADKWGSKIYGMVDYMQGFIPDKDTDQGKDMQASYDKLLDNAYHDYIVPMITGDARSTGKIQSVDSPGDWYNQIIGRKDIAFGTTKQASRNLIGELEKFIDEPVKGVMDALTLSRYSNNDEISKTVEEYADEIMEEGVLQELRGEKRLEEADPATGKFSLTWEEKDLKAMDAFGRGTISGKIEGILRGMGTAVTNPTYAAYKATENLGSQALTTVLGTGLSLTAQMIPKVKALNTIARMGIGLLASTPASVVGYGLESGDAFAESRDFMRKLRIRAKAEKGKISDEEFDQLYGIWLNKDYKITADMLEDEDITDIATELGQAYAKLATGIELVANNLQAGVAARQIAKSFGAKMAMKKSGLRSVLASKWYKNIMKGGGAIGALTPKGFLIEATEEGIQAWFQQSLLSDRLPQKQKDMSQVFSEAMAGGLFGQGMQFTVGGVSKAARLYQDTYGSQAIKSSVLEDETAQVLEQKAIDSKDPINDNLIIAGTLLDNDHQSLADKLYPGEENEAARNKVLSRAPALTEQIISLNADPRKAADRIINWKKQLEQRGLVINEETLDKAGPAFSDLHISQILEIPVEDLGKTGREEVVTVKPPIKSSKGKYSDLPDDIFPDEDFTQEPTYNDQDPIDVMEYQDHESQILEMKIDEIGMERHNLLDTPLSDQNITNAERQEKLKNLDKREAKLVAQLNKIENTPLPNASKKKTTRTLQERMTVKIAKIANKTAKKWVPKEQVKTRVATQFIGSGKRNSSTDKYRAMYQEEGLANTGKYTSSDIIYVSSNGNRKGRINPVKDGVLQGKYKNIDIAMEAGATFIMDTRAHLKQTKKYNKGEIDLATYLSQNGYTDNGKGVWKPSTGETVTKSKVGKDITPEQLNDKAKKAGLKVWQRGDNEWTVRKESGITTVDKEGLIELIGDGETAVQSKKVPLKKAVETAAANVKKKVNFLIPFNTLSPEVLEKLPEDKLIEYAKKLAVPTEGRSRNQIIADSVKAAPPIELQGGLFSFKVGFKSAQLRELHKYFLKAWADTVKNSDIIDRSDRNFQEWASSLGPLLPNHVKEAFYDWANDYRPGAVFVSKFVDPFLEAFQGNKEVAAALKITANDIDKAQKNTAENIAEGLHKKYSEGADVKIDNYTHINSAYFHGMGITLLKDQIKAIEDQVKLTNSFEEWVKVISQKEFGLINKDGLTPIDVIANNLEQGRLLNQYYVSNLPINNIKINRGDWVVDPETGKYESSQNKRVNLTIQKDKKGFKPNTLKVKKQVKQEATVGVDDITIRKGPTLPTIDRPTMFDRFGDYPLSWLHGSDIRSWQVKKDITGKVILNENGKPTGRFKSTYGFLNPDDISDLSRNVLAPRNKVPLLIRGDSDKLAIVDITSEHFELAKDYELYWEFEQAIFKIDDDTINSYKGLVKKDDGTWESLTDEELTEQYQSPIKYRAANIARHEAFKGVFGTDYHALDGHMIMHRNKILFTPTITRKGFRDKTVMITNLSDSKSAVSKGKASPLTTKTYYPGGKFVEKELVLKMAVGSEYVGDGQLLASQPIFDKDFPDEVGARKGVKRAKIVVVNKKGDNGLFLGKLQAMTYGLPSAAEKSEIFNGTKKIAEITRTEKGEIIYTPDKNGNFTVYTDFLGTTDEAKVQLGDEFRQFDTLMSFPSESFGHIQMTENDKSKAPFPMQTANYITDQGYIDNLNRLIDDPGGAYGSPGYNPNSPVRVLDKMYRVVSNSSEFDKFILDMRSRFPDAVPRTIVEAARLKAGRHPSQTDYGKVLVKNKLLIEAMDFKQKGAVLDFRANFTDTVEKGKMVAPFEHAIKDVIAEALSSLQSLDITSILGKSMSELNQLLKDNPVSIMMVRHPIGSRGGYRIYRIDKFESGLGDSFLINDKELKDVFEADQDHDTGHVSVLPTYMLAEMRKNQATLEGFDFSKYTKNIEKPNIGSLSESIRLMGDMSAGQTAIGEIANVQRVAGISQYIFNSMKIDGKVVKVRSLTSEMTNPETGEKTTLEEYYKLWGQAAFDNVKHRLLSPDAWDYSQQKLYERLFYNSNGEPLTEAQYEILNHSYIKVLKYTQAIKKGESFGNPLSLTEILKLSESYDTFVNNRERMIRQRLRGLELDGGWEGMANDLVEDIDLSPRSHPHETLATLPYRKMPQGLTVDDVLNNENLHSKAAHDIAYKSISDRQNRLEVALKAYGKDIGDPNLTFDKLTEEDYAEILQEIEKGEKWGSQMRSVMNSVYANFENDIEGEAPQREANSQTWDYNSDFTQFADDWINGTEGNVGYKELSEVAKVASTYQFLNGVWDPKNGHMQYNARKIPPQMEDRGIFVNETLMHPGVMLPFNLKYNEIIDDRNFNYKDYKINPQERLHKTIKRYFGCE